MNGLPHSFMAFVFPFNFFLMEITNNVVVLRMPHFNRSFLCRIQISNAIRRNLATHCVRVRTGNAMELPKDDAIDVISSI